VKIRRSRSVVRSFVWLAMLALMAALLSRDEERDTDAEPTGRIGSVRQALTDTDSDGLDDDWETTNFGGLSQTASGDFDSDGMTNLEEYTNGFNPTVNDAFEDADGDRYPNVFEVRNSADPNSSSSIPSPTYTVNGAGGGTHTTIAGALGAANVSNGQYQIIGIAAGTYSGASNLHDVSVASTKPKLLFIGLEGAGKTVIDGGLANWGWILNQSAVVASLTFQKTWVALYVDAAGKETRFVDLIVRDNTSGGASQWSAGVHIHSAAKTHIVGSTFMSNAGGTAGQQIFINSGTATITNTVAWTTTTAANVAKATGATLNTNYCLVKGQTLTGTGNLAGSTDPKLRTDLRLLWDSPLRAAGGTIAQSRIDIDGELRPSSTPDIGVDQFLDSDSDDVADNWEMAEAGNLTTLTGRTNADSDGLTNEQEHAAFLKPTVADTDGDGASDGAEVNTHGTNPLVTDTDGDDMPDGWEINNGLSPTVANGFEDKDGDRYPNVFEYASSTDPSNAASTPSPTYVVNASGGGTHTTIAAALSAATVTNGQYQIIGIAPGTYTGSANLHDVSVASTKPKLLFIGLEGASKTIIDGGLANWGWILNQAAVVSSLTFQRSWVALYVDATGKETRFVDLVVRDNTSGGASQWSAGVHVNAGSKTYVVGSTFLNNAGGSAGQQIFINAGAATVTNSVVWTTASGTNLAKAGAATLTTNYSAVKGQTLTGTGNLAGSIDPKLRSDARLLWNSPLRATGGTVAQSLSDMDGEVRPSSSPDIGADQFFDSDADDLADQWETNEVGNLTTLTSRTQDADSDGLTNEQECAAFTKPTLADTDGDGVSDGLEVNTHGSNRSSPIPMATTCLTAGRSRTDFPRRSRTHSRTRTGTATRTCSST
jgi:hypothetical protein